MFHRIGLHNGSEERDTTSDAAAFSWKFSTSSTRRRDGQDPWKKDVGAAWVALEWDAA